jgi:Cof subfamily protein (haloacid dehalogenase superfamily)
MDIKMVVCDLDGTLLTPSGKISAKTKETIRKLKERNILFGICSGRSAVALKELIHHWGIAEYVDFVLGFNGGMLYDPKTETFEQWHTVDKDDLPAVIESFKGYPVAFGEYTGRKFQATKANLLTRQMARRNKIDFEVCSEKDLLQDTSKFMAVGMPWTISRYLKNRKDLKGVRMFRSGPFLIEIIHPKLSKLEGVKILAQRYGLRPDQVLSFGNDNNDLEMLAGTRGVAMANALPQVKEAAPYLTLSNRRNGVADFIEKNVLNAKPALESRSEG